MTNLQGLEKMGQAYGCPDCGSDKTNHSGWRIRKDSRGHILYYKRCERYFTENPKYRGVHVDARQLLDKFVEGNSVREIANAISVSKSTVGRKLIEGLKEVPTWQETASMWLEEYQALKGDWFKDLVMDTTPMKVEGEKRTYLHAADGYTGLPLIYKIIDTPYEKEELISPQLRELRDLGYWPDVATIDGSMALYSALINTYGSVPIQFCLVHLCRDLKKDLKVKGPQFSLVRKSARNLILHAACSDRKTRQTMLRRLEDLINSCNDEVTVNVVENFFRKIDHYKTLEELKGHSEALTTNLCENHVKWIKVKLAHKLFGFKSLETAQKHIDLYWKKYIDKRLESKSLMSPKYRSMLFLLDGHISLEKLATLIEGATYEELLRIATKKKKEIIWTIKGHYPVSMKQIRKILAFSTKVDTIGQLADMMALDPIVVDSITRRYGKEAIFGYKVRVESINLMNLDLYFDEEKADRIFRALRIVREPETNTTLM